MHGQSVGSLRRGTSGRQHIEGEIKSITEFGLFVGLDDEIDGMVHLSDLVLGQAGRAGGCRLQERRHGQGEGARHRCRERAHQPRHQAARPAIRWTRSGPMKKGDIVTCTVTEVNDGGIEVSLADGVQGLHPPFRPRARPRRPASGAIRRGRQGRRHRHQCGQGQPQNLALHQGARSGRGERGRGAVRFVRFGRLAGRHSRRRAQEAESRGQGRREGDEE